MNKYKKTRVLRRKKERDEARETLENFADTLSMRIIDMVGIYPETLESAVLLLLDAREKLPVTPGATIYSSNPVKRIAFVLENVSTR